MAVRDTDQLGLDETVVDNETLEKLLEQRLRAAQDRAEVNGVFKRADAAAKAALATVDIPSDGAIRVGRFRIAKTLVIGHAVSFVTEDKDRLTISLLEDDGAEAASSAGAAVGRLTSIAPSMPPPFDEGDDLLPD